MTYIGQDKVVNKKGDSTYLDWNHSPYVTMYYDILAFSWGNSFDVYEHNSAIAYEVINLNDNSIYKTGRVEYSRLQPNAGIGFRFPSGGSISFSTGVSEAGFSSITLN